MHHIYIYIYTHTHTHTYIYIYIKMNKSTNEIMWYLRVLFHINMLYTCFRLCGPFQETNICFDWGVILFNSNLFFLLTSIYFVCLRVYAFAYKHVHLVIGFSFLFLPL